MGGENESFNSRRGKPRKPKGALSTKSSKTRNHRRTRALHRGVMTHSAVDLQLELSLVPAKNANEAARGCLGCGYVGRG
jgi:hypothetical protein